MYSARKPYLRLKQSIGEFFRAPVRFLKDSVTKESQFEKPYMEDDYQAMHLNLPKPDWPSWDFGRGNKPWARAPKEDIYADPQRCESCTLQVWDNDDDCEKPVEFFMMLICTNYPGTIEDCNFSASAFKGAIKSQGPSESHIHGWDVYVDPEINDHGFLGFFTDGAGNVCWKAVEVSCACCPAKVTFEFDDDNTPLTIVAGNSINVYVLGGCAPFTYSVSGTGYSWSGSGTSSYESNNRNEQLNCVGGT